MLTLKKIYHVLSTQLITCIPLIDISCLKNHTTVNTNMPDRPLLSNRLGLQKCNRLNMLRYKSSNSICAMAIANFVLKVSEKCYSTSLCKPNENNQTNLKLSHSWNSNVNPIYMYCNVNDKVLVQDLISSYMPKILCKCVSDL